MTSSHSECRCADCGIEITGIPIVPVSEDGPTRAQTEKLKPTTYLCIECAREQGFSFIEVVFGEKGAKQSETD